MRCVLPVIQEVGPILLPRQRKVALHVMIDACIAWKSKKFCSHILAVAENSNCLSDFLSSYRRAKVVGSYTAVSTHNQSKSVGKKPGHSKRKGPVQYKRPEIENYIDPLQTEAGVSLCSSSDTLFTSQRLTFVSASSSHPQVTSSASSQPQLTPGTTSTTSRRLASGSDASSHPQLTSGAAYASSSQPQLTSGVASASPQSQFTSVGTDPTTAQPQLSSTSANPAAEQPKFWSVQVLSLHCQ